MTMTQSRHLHLPEGACHVTVLADRCAGCQECLVRCPVGALDMDPERWVIVADDASCVGCRQCVRTCPFSAITVAGPARVADRQAVAVQHPQRIDGDTTEIRQGLLSWEEALTEAARCLSCPDPTCVRGCPAHNDIPSFIAALSTGDLDAAQETLRRTTVIPDVCSRVCDSSLQCEGACTWSLAGAAPVAIAALERFVADHAPVPPVGVTSRLGEGLSVAVVGSGPAGMGAAWDLLAAAAKVTVYEADARPGGLLNWGIPSFTLPTEVSDRPWADLLAAGADLRCGVRVSPEDLDDLLEIHDAVVLAHGAGVALSLPVPGADLPGVEDATTFLKRAKWALDHGAGLEDLNPRDGRPVKVLVLGAGNTAMDVARSARRLGADAICVDWMDRRYAPVRADELAEAEDEGVEVRFSFTLRAIGARDGRVGTATLSPTVQKSAKSRPRVLDHGATRIDVDLVVAAMGYRLDPAFASQLAGTPVRRQAPGVPDRRWQASGILANPAPVAARGRPVGRLALGREVALVASASPFRERTWVAGDALIGPSTVVEAMAQGRRAARAVLHDHPAAPHRSVGSHPAGSSGSSSGSQ
ncbi:MAG: FAD-dependent oxidoreductase [Actinomycetota bacterium]|nr:FAD-dependent oxidoreductase [Actinomycetota bacterium]